MTGAPEWDGVRERAGAGARRVAGTQAGHWAGCGCGAGAAAQSQAHLPVGILGEVPVWLRCFTAAAAEGEDPP